MCVCVCEPLFGLGQRTQRKKDPASVGMLVDLVRVASRRLWDLIRVFGTSGQKKERGRTNM